MSDQEQLISLKAQNTALTMLVESLWTTILAGTDDPKQKSKEIIDAHFDSLKKLQAGETTYALQVSDAMTSILDRATSRAVLLKQKGRRT